MKTTSKVQVVEYDPNWPKIFEELKAWISIQLSGFHYNIEHVGSTAVPGMAAKPKIDLDILVPDQSQIPLIISKLEKLGYQHAGDLGIQGREAFNRKDQHVPYSEDNKIWMEHNLYLCLENISAVKNHLFLRDTLLDDPELVRKYSHLKKTLAKQFPMDMDAYTAGKTKFILSILEKSGMSKNEILDIRDQNTI